MCKFSIIIPCYNAEKDVLRLIKMFENKEYTDYEVIFIDDCSTDNTYELLIENKLQHFSVYKMENNSGPGMVRNYGIHCANAENIMFCDSDDEFDISVLGEIDDFLEKHADADLIVFPHKMVGKNKEVTEDSYSKYNNGDKVDIYDILDGCPTPWAKIYKKSVIYNNNVVFPARMTGEDRCFLVNYAVYVKVAYKCDLLYYRYIMTEGSITHRRITDPNQKTTFEILQKVYAEHFPEIELKMFVDTHLLSKAKILCDAKCSMKHIGDFYLQENKKFPNWIDKIDISSQSLYRQLIYKAMYNNNALAIKAIMFVRRILY